MSDTATFRTQTTKGFSHWSIDQIHRRSAEHISGIAFRAASIPETHCQRSTKADQPNRRAQ
jgi:hypothetical protein